jgi:hypothetical protein
VSEGAVRRVEHLKGRRYVEPYEDRGDPSNSLRMLAATDDLACICERI